MNPGGSVKIESVHSSSSRPGHAASRSRVARLWKLPPGQYRGWPRDRSCAQGIQDHFRDARQDEHMRRSCCCEPGAKVVITPTAVAPEDPRSYYEVARKYAREIPNAILANQYHNPDNPRAHELTTAVDSGSRRRAGLRTSL
jgi:hypothetical protein